MKKVIITISAALLFVIALCLLAGTSSAQTWAPNKSVIKPAKDTAAAKADKFQCWGTTQKGLRCKRKVNEDHSFCYLHQYQAPFHSGTAQAQH